MRRPGVIRMHSDHSRPICTREDRRAGSDRRSMREWSRELPNARSVAWLRERLPMRPARSSKSSSRKADPISIRTPRGSSLVSSSAPPPRRAKMIRLMTDSHSTTFRAALYARVSTEDRQAPEDSIAWQRSVAAALIEASGGRIVVEYLDVGVSRSLPWSRRPEAARLLSDCGRRDRGFDAVVIGEPQRAFSGAQFALTFPLFVHHGVELWVPEVGGRVDPDSEAHDLVMSLFGGLEQGGTCSHPAPRSQRDADDGSRRRSVPRWTTAVWVPTRLDARAPQRREGSSRRDAQPSRARSDNGAHRPAHLQRAARREELQRYRADAQRERNPLAVSRRSSPQFASRSERLGSECGARDPYQPSLHRPRGLEPSTT